MAAISHKTITRVAGTASALALGAAVVVPGVAAAEGGFGGGTQFGSTSSLGEIGGGGGGGVGTGTDNEGPLGSLQNFLDTQFAGGFGSTAGTPAAANVNLGPLSSLQGIVPQDILEQIAQDIFGINTGSTGN